VSLKKEFKLYIFLLYYIIVGVVEIDNYG